MNLRNSAHVIRRTESSLRYMTPGKIVTSMGLILFSMAAIRGQGFPAFVNIESYVREVYRKPTKKELETVKLDPRVLAKYEEFLKLPHTGLFRFLPDEGCYENQEIVSANEKCLNATMPGNGTSFSFRMQNYRARRFADLSLSGNNFVATGIFAHGILVKLGELPVESVNSETPGMGYIMNFEPVTDLRAAKEIGAMLTKGVKRDGFSYGQTIPIVENATYAIRSVAYRGQTFRTIKGAIFNEIDFDKRADVVVVFKVVERSADGSICILWKEISRKEAPKIKNTRL
jgi:hypothetical protein